MVSASMTAKSGSRIGVDNPRVVKPMTSVAAYATPIMKAARDDHRPNELFDTRAMNEWLWCGQVRVERRGWRVKFSKRRYGRGFPSAVRCVRHHAGDPMMLESFCPAFPVDAPDL